MANNIRIPRLVKAGESITAVWANDIRRAIIELANRVPVVKNAIERKRAALPFAPTLKTITTGEGESVTTTYSVRVARGQVIETIVADPTPKYWLPDGIVDTGAPVWHEITDGQAVYCTIEVDAKGVISENPIIEVDADDAEDVHYYPQGGESTGSAGTHRYKLFVFSIVDSVPRLEWFCSGSHIQHYAERPTLVNLSTSETGTSHKVVKAFVGASDEYQFRPIHQLSGGVPILSPVASDHIPVRPLHQRATGAQVTVAATGDGKGVLVAGNSYGAAGAPISVTNARVTMSVIDGLVTDLTPADDDGQDLDLVTWEFNMTTSGGFLIEGTPAYAQYVDCWRAGVYVGSFDHGDPLPAATGGGVVLTTRNVSYVTLT